MLTTYCEDKIQLDFTYLFEVWLELFEIDGDNSASHETLGVFLARLFLVPQDDGSVEQL